MPSACVWMCVCGCVCVTVCVAAAGKDRRWRKRNRWERMEKVRERKERAVTV